MSLNIEQLFITAAIKEQIIFRDPVTPSVEKQKQQVSLQETPPQSIPACLQN